MHAARPRKTPFFGPDAIKKLVKLSPDARDWLTLSLDPFHDWSKPVAGYPDSDSSRTIVSCYQYALDVAKPAGAAGLWDSHVFVLPTCPVGGGALIQQLVSNGGQFTPVIGAQTQRFQTVCVNSADSGQPLFAQPTAVWAPTNLNMQSIDMGADVAVGASRVIGMGIEVVNTTADIYKQGSLVAYRMPQMPSKGTGLFCSPTGTQGGAMEYTSYRYLPATVGDTVLLRGTEQWTAAEGVYMAVPFSTVTNPITTAGPNATLLTNTGVVTNGQHVLADQFSGITANNNLPVTTASLPWNQKRLPICTTGIFLTGLSAQTTFRIKVKVYVEAAPTFADAKLAVLSTLSAPYDARALQMYSSLVNVLPVAVRYHCNAEGDWWRMILDAITSIAPMMGVAMGFPVAGYLAGAVSSTARMILPKGSVPQAANVQHNRESTAQKLASFRTVQKAKRHAKKGKGAFAPD